MNELDRQASTEVAMATVSKATDEEASEELDSNDNATKLQGLCLLRSSAKKKKARPSN
jgi:hypothetical protein